MLYSPKCSNVDIVNKQGAKTVLSGRALITGGTSGMGAAFAYALAKKAAT